MTYLLYFYILIKDLPFKDVLSCGATCRTILYDAMPLLRKICIDTAWQMNMTVARRFRDVKEIHINSLMTLIVQDAGTEDEFKHINVCRETKMRVVPFLSRFDMALKRVHFGGKDEEDDDIVGFAPAGDYFSDADGEPYPDDGDRECMLSFLDMISGAFRCGVLSKQIVISGLCCPDLNDQRGAPGPCETCVKACNSFPLKSVVTFECEGSSIKSARLGRLCSLDVCLERARIESIIESRPDGHELLHSDERIFHLLRSGRRYTITSDEREQSFYVVKYNQDELEEIKRVIEYAEIDPKKLSMQRVSSAIIQSFAADGDSRIPPKEQRYFSEKSLDYLVNNIGLPIDKEDFDTPLNASSIPLIIKGLERRFDTENENNDDYDEDGMYADIDVDLMVLIRRFLSVEHPSTFQLLSDLNNLPIHRLTDLSAVPLLAKYLKEKDELKEEAAGCIMSIIVKGSGKHMKMVIDAGVIPSLSQMLASTTNSVAKVAILTLAEIVMRGSNKDTIDTMAKAETITSLIGLLDSNDDICVESSLRVLVEVVSKMPTKICIIADQRNLLRHLVGIMKSHKCSFWAIRMGDKSDTAKLKYLPLGCSILLRKMLEYYPNSSIQSIIELSALPRLIEIMNSTGDATIQINFEFVMISLLGESNVEQVGSLKDTGLIDIVVGLMESQDDDISEKAITAATNLANSSVYYCDLLMQVGIVKRLIRLLNESSLESILKAAALALTECCDKRKKSKQLDITTSKDCLEAIAQHLLNDRQDTLLSRSCCAIYNILEGFESEKINEVLDGTDMGFLTRMLQLLPSKAPYVQKPIWRCIKLIASAGDVYIKAIFDAGGISHILKALFSAGIEKNQEPACGAISIILAKDAERIQAAIDNNIVPGLLRLFKGKLNKIHVLKLIEQITQNGNAAQIQHLVSMDIANHLCKMLAKDCDVAAIALRSLQNVSI